MGHTRVCYGDVSTDAGDAARAATNATRDRSSGQATRIDMVGVL